MKFGDKLEALLTERGLSQTTLAWQIGVKPPQVSRWRNGDEPPKVASLLKIARALGTSVEYLIDDGQEAPPIPLSEDEQAALLLYRRLRAARGPGGTALVELSDFVTGACPAVDPAAPGSVAPSEHVLPDDGQTPGRKEHG